MFFIIMCAVCMWSSIMRDLAQIKTIQKIEIESMIKLEVSLKELDRSNKK